MRLLVNIVLVVAIGIAISCSGSSLQETETTVATLTDMEQKLARAWVDADREGIDTILAHDWTVTDPTGRVLTKKQVLEETFGSGDRKIEALKIEDVKVRPFGNMAVVTGRTVAVGSYQGTRSTVVLRFTDVFARRNGQWQIVASQGTAVTQ